MSLKNATTPPRRYFGLHMCEGVAQYHEQGKEPYRIFIGEETLKNMDSTFDGRPVYVHHVDEVDLSKIKDADGFVNKSFYNAVDGKHWVEFIITTDRGHEAIVQKKWKLSNAYFPRSYGNGGQWHGVDYTKEVLQGEYEHLAIVPNPRYEESIILTPEEFKRYNNEKELELKRLANEKEKGESSMLNLFKKTKVDNSKEFEDMVVTLPKSKVEMPLVKAIEELDAIKNMHGYANEEHMVKCGDEEMSVKQMAKKYQAMLEEKKANEEGDEDEEKKNADDPVDEELEEKKKKDAGKKNSKDEDESGESDESEEKLDAEIKKLENAKKLAEKKARLEALKNAHLDGVKPSSGDTTDAVDFSEDQVARGKVRYGSEK